jgi:hypothetical protein
MNQSHTFAKGGNAGLLLPLGQIDGAVRDAFSMRGRVHIELRDKRGRLKDVRDVHNLVVTSGKSSIASRFKGTATAAMTHMAVGTDATAPAVTQAALVAEVGGSRTALTSTTVRNNEVIYVCTLGAGVGTGALVEAGMFNGTAAAAAGLSYTRSSNTVTVTKTTHGLAVDRAIGIAAATDTGLNGGATIQTVPTADTFTFYTTSGGANGTLTLYQDVMATRSTFSVVNKGAADSMTITWTLTIS